MIQVDKQRKINRPQATIVSGEQIKAAVGLPSQVGGHHRTPGAHPHVDRLVPTGVRRKSQLFELDLSPEIFVLPPQYSCTPAQTEVCPKRVAGSVGGIPSDLPSVALTNDNP